MKNILLDILRIISYSIHHERHIRRPMAVLEISVRCFAHHVCGAVFARGHSGRFQIGSNS